MKFPVTGNVIFLAYFLNMGGGRHFGRRGHAYGNFNVYYFGTGHITFQYNFY